MSIRAVQLLRLGFSSLMDVRHLFKGCWVLCRVSLHDEFGAGGACAIHCLVCARLPMWAVDAADGRVVAFGPSRAVRGETPLCCGLMFFCGYRASCFLRTALLIVPVPLALVASGSAVVGSHSLKAASVVEHAYSAFWNGDVSGDADDDCAAFTGSKGLR